jgi:hypothetical protein
MPTAKQSRTKPVRRSITLPPRIAKQVESIEAAQQKEKAFFQLAERFRAASDPDQVKQLGNELGRFVFGQDLWLRQNREELDAKIRRGLDQLDRGEGIPEDQLDAYLAKMKAHPE